MNSLMKNKERTQAVQAREEDFFTRWWDTFFDGSLYPVWNSRETWMPAFDIHETDQAIMVSGDIPGVDEKNIHVEVKDNVLSVRGEKEARTEQKDARIRRVERTYGSFERSFALPEGVKTEKITAEYKKGVITLTIPKGKEKTPKQVQVKVS